MNPGKKLTRLKKERVNTAEDPEWADEEIKLKNMAVRPYTGASDWRSENGEVIITVTPITQHLKHNWERQARKTNSVDAQAVINGEPAKTDDYVELYKHSDFENDFKGPGLYRDSQHMDEPEKVDEAYTIILPENFLTPKMMDNYIEALNEKFDRNFVHKELDVKSRMKNLYESKIKEEFDEEDEKIDEIIDKVLEETTKW